ncbi:DegV family protein [Mesoplasma corruscae]|uniref:Fatty acid-binding protein DegV n=1 Tax=Mesoplasma corruscae TaxID=216874 RepID=A0A2S5RHD4_9MOLU|nr:DegV family protein [Mesoplasma corruscae]PPE06749.1 fatty acid-binding protein DegV [Mesoplasma corruscae]
MKIAILTDSSYDGDISKIKDLYLVPLLIVEDDGTTHLCDENFDKDKFYKMLESQNLKTAQTTPGLMMEMWDKLLKEYDQVIFLPISKGLSGQFNTFRFFSESEENYKDKVFVCDTNAVSIAMQEIVENVAFWIAQKKTGFEIVELVKKRSEQLIGFIIPRNLNTLKRGGRISPAAASLAKMLKIVPILRYNGIIDKEKVARTRKKAINEALDLIKNEIKNIKIINISYSRMSIEELEDLKYLISEKGFEINISSELSPVIAAHTGEGTIALLAYKGEI